MLCIFICFTTSQILKILTTFVLFLLLLVTTLPYYCFFHIIILFAHIFCSRLYIQVLQVSFISFFFLSPASLHWHISSSYYRTLFFFTYHLIRSFQFFVFRLMCVDPHFSWWEGMLESCITSVFVYSFRILWCFFRFIYRSLYSLKRADSTKRNKNEHREGTGVVLMVTNIK